MRSRRAVHLYDIKWPSVRSIFIQVLFICDEYQWPGQAGFCRSRFGRETDEGELSLDTERAQPPAGKSALAVTAPAKAAVPALA